MVTRRTPPATEQLAPARSATRANKPQRTKEPENWDQRLGFLMHDVSRLRRTVFDEFVRPMGVTRSQWWVLAHVARQDGMIQSELANVLELGKAALGGLIDRLEAAELVHRGADGHDRRVKRVFLSPKGAQLVKEMEAPSRQLSEHGLEGLDPQARRNLVDLMTRVKINLQTMRGSTEGGLS
jgi:MarR family transcriptional regulator, transcriptional regulator for hemolysin